MSGRPQPQLLFRGPAQRCVATLVDNDQVHLYRQCVRLSTATLLGGIALAQAIPPIATHFPVAWSVCYRLSSVTLLTMLTPFDEFRYHLTGTLVGSNDTLCQTGSLTLQGRANLGVEPCRQNMQFQIAAATWRIRIEKKRFRLFSKLLWCLFVLVKDDGDWYY